MNIIPVSSAHKPILLNLLQAYEAEFSVLTCKDPDENGLYPLDTFLDHLHLGYLLFIDQTPSGFAIKSIRNNIHQIDEFYIIPTKRRSKIGQRFAHAIFDKFPGDWQVRQIRNAIAAKTFWQNCINDYTGGSYSESEQKDSKWGTVSCQTFIAPGPK